MPSKIEHGDIFGLGERRGSPVHRRFRSNGAGVIGQVPAHIVIAVVVDTVMVIKDSVAVIIALVLAPEEIAIFDNHMPFGIDKRYAINLQRIDQIKGNLVSRRVTANQVLRETEYHFRPEDLVGMGPTSDQSRRLILIYIGSV